MLFAVVKRINKPVKIVTWMYLEPGILDHVVDESGKVFKPYSLIPIGYKRYHKMVQDARVKAEAEVGDLILYSVKRSAKNTVT